MFAEISPFSDSEKSNTARPCSSSAHHFLAIACNCVCVISCFSVFLLFRLLILMCYYYYPSAFLNLGIQIRAKLSCFACLFRACRRFFVVLILLTTLRLSARCGRSLEIFRGVWRDIPALCPRRPRNARRRTRQAFVYTLDG